MPTSVQRTGRAGVRRQSAADEMPDSSETPSSTQGTLDLLCELIRQSMELWEINADVVQKANIIAIYAGERAVVVRYDLHSPIAVWWVATKARDCAAVSREKPCTGSLGVLSNVRRILAADTDADKLTPGP